MRPFGNATEETSGLCITKPPWWTSLTTRHTYLQHGARTKGIGRMVRKHILVERRLSSI